MQTSFSKEQLGQMDKELLIQLFLSQQQQLEEMDKKLQKILEQLADSNRQFVERAARVIREFGNEVATPDDAREILSLK